jgi:hypothetical protein
MVWRAAGQRVEFTDVKAPEPVQGIPPWQDSQWLAAAEEWIEAACARAGLARTGQVLARGRPYSVVARVPTEQGTVWFKASPPASRFEPALLAALAAWHPERFTAPIAIEEDRAWSLTRDGGSTLQHSQPQTPDTVAWHATLRGYAQLQVGLASRAGDLLALGMADLRPRSVPDQLEKLVADPAIRQVIDTSDGITRGQYRALHELVPRLRKWCAELDDLGIPASLEHADVHPNNIFAATGAPFDWGDASVAHPFASLFVVLRTAAEPGSLPQQTPELAALTENYLSPWLEAGYPRAAADRSLTLALRIAPLARALAWGRLFPCYLGHPAPAARAARWVAAMLEPAASGGTGRSRPLPTQPA